MLEKLRNAAKTWVAGLFIGLLILSFAVWGINDIFTGTANTDVAKVGDVGISQDAFDREFRQRIEILSNQTGQTIDTIQARQFGIDRQVLSELVQQTVLSQATENMGLTVSDDALAESIRSDDAFKGVMGEFSAQTYNDLLAINRMTPASYEARLRRDLIRQQLIVSLIAGLEGSRTLAEALHAYREEKREVEYLVIAPENAAGLAAPTEEEIAEFHKNNEDLFRAPEYRTFSYVFIEPENYMDQVEVSDEDLRGIYDFSGDRFVTPEKRTVRIMTFADEEAAKTAHAQITADKTFALVAEENGFDVDEITQTNALQSELLDAGVAAVVFSMEETGVSAPINGDIGWAVAEVTSITPKEGQSFEEVKDIILEEEKRKQAVDLVYDKVAEFQDAFAAGGGLAEAANQIGLSAKKVGPIDRSGKTPAGAIVSEFANRSATLRTAFDIDVGLESDLIDTSNEGFAMVRVDNVTESRIKPVAEVRSKIVEAVAAKNRQEKLSQIAAGVADKANAGTPFKDLAAEFNRAVLKAKEPLTRASTDELFSSSLVNELFTKKSGEFVYGPAAFGESFVIAVTRSIAVPSADDDPENVRVYEQVLQQGVQSDVLEQYMNHLNETLDVRLYQDAVDRALGASPES